MDQALYRVIGKSSKPYFRPPYGDRDERVKSIAASEGYQSVFWTTDAMDWLELSGGETNDSVINRINVNLRPGAIYLMHIGDKITGEILDKVLTDIQNLGFEIVPLTQGI
jgi:peptidoglycan/xylan/chitin deacetylase (PgdA/CDA1 family)